MLLLHSLVLLFVSYCFGQDTALVLSGSNTLTLPSVSSISGSVGDFVPSGSSITYLTYSATTTLPTGSNSGSIAVLATTIAIVNGSTLISSISSSQSFSLLSGRPSPTSTVNSTTNNTFTSSSEPPTNTTPCNGYPEFCSLKYSNITHVAAHNSPFVLANNAASNQDLPVLAQLNDGIRMLQGQTHFFPNNNTIYYCHTSCDILNAGTAESYFRTVNSWVASHPYDVLTLLIGNADSIGVGNYTSPLEASGLSRYVYTPPKIPMSSDDWPTLGEMILMSQRVVIFMDYHANQTEVPYILDEFSQMWETPFSPTNRSFPCLPERPPGLSDKDARDRLYLANHNLNTEIPLGGSSLLVPTTTLLNETNAASGFGSLGLAANNCRSEWGKPPNFLMVDYYEMGNVRGSVFQVAAAMNNVTHDLSRCCGQTLTNGGRRRSGFEIWSVGSVVGLWVLWGATLFMPMRIHE